MPELVVYHSDLKLKKGLVDDVGLVLPVTPELHKYPVLLLQCFQFWFFHFYQSHNIMGPGLAFLSDH